MTLDEFKLELVKLGYKVSSDTEQSFVRHTRYKKRNKEICIQKFDVEKHYNLYFDIDSKNHNISTTYKQREIINFKKALANILKFERKLQ
jgi:hypothetical protein